MYYLGRTSVPSICRDRMIPLELCAQALVDKWLADTGGASSPATAPSLLVVLRAPPATPASGSINIASAAATLATRLLFGGTAVSVAPDGTVREPISGAFDVTVVPGQLIQAAVDACPPGGSVLLLPGTHDGPLVLTAGKVVHVFGRGLATLRAATGTVVTSDSDESTLDGLVIRREAGGTSNDYNDCVWIKGGLLRMQACDVTSAFTGICVVIEGGADPMLLACRCVRAASGPSLACKCTHARRLDLLWPPCYYYYYYVLLFNTE